MDVRGGDSELLERQCGPGLASAVTMPSMLERLHAAGLRRVHGLAEAAVSLASGRDGTTGKHELAELTIASRNSRAGVHFVSTPWAVLNWVHALLLADAEGESWTFVDLGAGKGRAVLSAATKPYARVIGVEFAAELAAVARANVAAAGLDAQRIAIVEGDAATFAFPREPLAVFLFNPFGPPVIDEVAARLATHRRTCGQPVRVAYVNPVHAASFSAAAGFRPRPLPSRAAALFAIASPYRLSMFDAT